MRTEFLRAPVPHDLRSLIAFDHKAFHDHPSDWFDRQAWEDCEAWWMLVNGKKIGCCAFQRHRDFREDITKDGTNPYLRGSLYIVTTGILPQSRGHGLGRLLKCWQISYAQHHRFSRIVTNTRKHNHAMIRLNESFGFRTIRTTPHYYAAPDEATVVMELRLAGERN
jgi:ribosomal protein S18 acetylase RimI-like enzyme